MKQEKKLQTKYIKIPVSWDICESHFVLLLRKPSLLQEWIKEQKRNFDISDQYVDIYR